MIDKHSKAAHVHNGSHGLEFENTAAADIIELRNVSQSYDNGKTFVIKDLQFLIEQKEEQGNFVVLVGKSGCGKSTLLRYIAGLQKPTSGEIFVYGQPKADEDTFSMVFQKYSSFPWLTVLQNVMFPLKLKGTPIKQAREQATEMIARVGLAGHEKKYAQAPTLSGGQLQRVAIARSLINSPKLLLMDEPFGALDTHTRMDMQLLLQDIWLRDRPTIILVTHDISETVFLGDDIFIMSSNPATIVDYIHVDLPLERKRSIKSDSRFIEYCQYIENQLVQI